mmetsp:Transcript_53663/g.121014  ORF Transcript_53663/g.121014 Transcript_53663/m.121014 type:complete len:244 (+) Transcript_53663:800-1531(+)
MACATSSSGSTCFSSSHSSTIRGGVGLCRAASSLTTLTVADWSLRSHTMTIAFAVSGKSRSSSGVDGLEKNSVMVGRSALPVLGNIRCQGRPRTAALMMLVVSSVSDASAAKVEYAFGEILDTRLGLDLNSVAEPREACCGGGQFADLMSSAVLRRFASEVEDNEGVRFASLSVLIRRGGISPGLKEGGGFGSRPVSEIFATSEERTEVKKLGPQLWCEEVEQDVQLTSSQEPWTFDSCACRC